jgi:hypothetical protein
MKSKPILFSTPMVQAILEGRKTQTRRIVKKQFLNGDEPKFSTRNSESTGVCPFGKIGDVLWVKETSCFVLLEHAHILLEGARDKNQMMFKASVHEDWMKFAKEKFNYKWKPSLFMSKDEARIWLKITNIRVQRLQDIDSGDAISEGIEFWWSDLFAEYRYKDYANVKDDWRSAVSSFKSLWSSINGINSWDDDPWVWVIEFERIEKPSEV